MKGNLAKRNNNVILLLDMICILVSYLFAASLRNGILRQGFLFTVYGSALAVVLIYYIISYEFIKENKENICKRGFYKEFITVLKNHFAIGIVLISYLYITKQSVDYSRFFFFIFLIVNITLNYLVRCYFKVIVLVTYKKSQASSKIMLVTTSTWVEETISKMRGELEWSIFVNSIVILDKDMSGQNICKIPVLKVDKNSLIENIKSLVVDEVFFRIPIELQSELQDIIIELENMGIIIHVSIDSYFNFYTKNKKIEEYLGYQVITFASQLPDEGQMLLKRLLDIVGGLFGTILLLIITLIVGPAIKIESQGPIFFTQKRMGKNGRMFKMYKFRSMYADAEKRKAELMDKNEMKGLMFKMEQDPRITKVGNFLRKTSLDEFPQFFNVLKGDMSLVGTRPPTLDEYVRYESLHRRRLSIKPGITGLWQVSGRSDITDFEDVVKFDLEYIDNWTIWMDIKLLVKTVVVVIFRVGAR